MDSSLVFQEPDALPSVSLNGKISISSSQASELEDLADESLPKIDVDDDIDDELDPAMKEELDR